MGERDAFGREKGEDSLAGLGWSSSAGSPAPTPVTPAPAGSPTPKPIPVSISGPGPTLSAGEPLTGSASSPAWTPGPPASYTRRRRRRARGIIVPLFIIGLVVVGIGGATTAFNAGSNALDNFSSSIEQATKNDSTTTTKTPLSGTSLMQPAALKAALAKLPAGHVELLRLAPDRINANVIVNGKLHAVQVSAGGDVSDVSTPAKGTGETIKVNSVAPSRIIKTVTKRTGRRPSSVDYLVLIHIVGKDEWQLFFDDGMHFSASANGKKVHRVS